MAIVDWIEFGQVAAERDTNLPHYFYDNGVLSAVIANKNQFLILGRKGAGKTAVFKVLQDNPAKYINVGDHCVTLSLQDYNWDIHRLLIAEGKAPSLAYLQSWKYVIYLTVLSVIIDTGHYGKKVSDAAKVISKIYSSPSPGFFEVIGGKLMSLSKVSLPKGNIEFDGVNFALDGGEVAFEEVKGNDTLRASLNYSIGRLTEFFENALLDELTYDRRLFVAFDRIDEAWDIASFGHSQPIIAGLIGAAESITAKFKGYIRPIVFLREDIFEILDLNDKNKLRADCGRLLAWGKAGLERMILERINFYARQVKQPEFSAVADVFNRAKMRQGRSTFDYLLLRTMLRPRDFIRFFQLVKEDMNHRANDPFAHDKIDPAHLECESIYNAESAYSEWLVEEIKDEWRVQRPEINSLLTALRHHGFHTLTKDELLTALHTSSGAGVDIDIQSALRFLYDNSVIGFRLGKSQQWQFKCFNPSRGFVDAEVFKVHDGLHRGLTLKEKRAPMEVA